jgi:hypothetical protein
MQLTPRSKRAIDLAYEEARAFSHNYIGTEHLLLGLIREGGGVGARVLRRMNVAAERVREEVRRQMEEEGTPPPPTAAADDTPGEPLKGDVGVLRNEDGREPVEVPTSLEAAREWDEVSAARDHHGYREMVLEGRMLLVPAGTEARVLGNSDPLALYVRILTGEHEGRLGWVIRGQYENRGPDDRPFPPPIEEPV